MSNPGNSDSPLLGKTAAVLGGGTGIGEAVALALAEEGMRVVIGGRRKEPLKAVALKHEAIETEAADVADRASLARFFETVGAADVVVNSAGINVAKRTLLDLSPEDFDRVMSVNASGVYNVMHASLPAMRERGDGLIVNVVSIAGLRALELAGAAYCASKFAADALGTYAGLEEGQRGIRVTSIHPGEVETPILDQRPEPVSAERRAAMLQPEDVAAAVLMVAKLPPRAHVPDLTIKPTVQKFA